MYIYMYDSYLGTGHMVVKSLPKGSLPRRIMAVKDHGGPIRDE